MANVDGTFYSGQTGRLNSSPESPPDLQGEQPFPVNPPGTNPSHDPLTIGTPTNGLSLSGQELSLSLSSTSTIGALSSTDWDTFNNKIGGSIANTQVAFGDGANVISGDTGFTWDNVNKRLSISGVGQINRDNSLLNISASLSIRDQQTTLVADTILSGIDFYTEDPSYASRVTNRVARITPYSNSGVGEAFGLAFYTSLADSDANIKWRISSSGVLEAIGSQTVKSSTGNIVLQAGSGSGNVVLQPDTGGFVGVNVFLATNTLDVNGDARIRNINNLGSTPASVLVPSATGVVSLRTLAEFVADAGISNLWTDATTFIYRDSPVVIGRTTLPTNATFAVQSKTATGIDKFFLLQNSVGTELVSIDNNGQTIFLSPILRTFNATTNASTTGVTFKSTSTSTPSALRVLNNSDNIIFDVLGNGILNMSDYRIRTNNATVNVIDRGPTFRGQGTTATLEMFRITNSANTILFDVLAQGDVRYFDGGDFILGTTTGTKIGTATTQKLAFWDKTPIVQPTTSITAATFVANTSGIADDTATFGGYTIGQIAAALIAEGLLA